MSILNKIGGKICEARLLLYASLGCYNKMPWTERIVNKKLISYGSGGWKFKSRGPSWVG